MTPEQAKANYDTALTAQAAARAIIENLKASSADTIITYERAKAAYEALKPSQTLAKAKLQRADADVTIARAEWYAVAPEAPLEKKGTTNADLLIAVKAFLADKPEGANNQYIYDGLVSTGVEMAGDKARANLNSYLSRWGAAGVLVSKGMGKWGVVAPAIVPTFAAHAFVPAEQVAPVETPSFLAPPSEPVAAPISVDVLGADFPGVEALAEAGFVSLASLEGKTAIDLVAIPGIGAKTAEKILAALAV